MTDTFFRPADSLRDAHRANRSRTRRAAIRCRAKCTTRTPSRSAASPATPGLFSTAADLAVFAQMMLNGGEYDGTRIIADSTVALFTKRAAGTRALGWDTCGGSGSCGKYLSEDAYGHTGVRCRASRAPTCLAP